MAHELPTRVVQMPWHRYKPISNEEEAELMSQHMKSYLDEHHPACQEYIQKEMTYYCSCICDYIKMAKEEE